MAVNTSRREDYKTHWSNIQNLKHKINIDLVQQILVERGNVNCLVQEGFTPLYLASLEGDSRLIRALIDRGAEVDQPSKDGKTPLYVACKNGHEDAVKLLLDSGAEVNLISLPTDCKETCLNVAWRLGHLEIVKILLGRGAKPNRILETEANYELLDQAVRNGHSELVTLMLENGLRVNWVNKEGETLLYAACSMGHLNIVNTLLDHGIHINCSSSFGGSSLYIACLNSHFSIAKLLLERGVDVGNKDTGYQQPSTPPLYVVAKAGHTELVRLMLDKGAEVNRAVRAQKGETPLHIACLNGHYDIVKLLLDRGADTSLFTDCQIDETSLHNYQQTLFTPLMLAVLKGHSQIVRLLLNRGSPLNQSSRKDVSPLSMSESESESDSSPVNNAFSSPSWLPYVNRASRPDQVSPLWLCCREGNYDMVKILLEYGVNPNVGKRVGDLLHWSPLYIAMCLGHKRIVRLLLQVGANIKNMYLKEPNILLVAYKDGHYDILTDFIEQIKKFNCASFDLEELLRAEHIDIIDACVERGITKYCFRNESSEVTQFEEHLKKLKVLGLFDSVLPADEETLEKYNTEIKEMKAFKVYNNMSLYVVLERLKDPYYLRNEDLLKELEKHINSPSAMKMFPFYCQILKNRLLSSKYRLTLFAKVSEALEGQEWWDNFPSEVQDNILQCLDNMDLEKMCNH